MGRFQVRRKGIPVPDRNFGGRQPRRLLAMLALQRGEVVTRDALIDALWPRGRPDRPGANLNAIVGRLRKALEERDLVQTAANGYVLTDGNACIVDIEEFERAVHDGFDLVRRNLPREALSILSAALDSWDQPLPEETYTEWASDSIGRLRSLRLDALEAAASAASRSGNHRPAIRYAREAVDGDKLRESAAVTLARSQALGGDTAAALATLDRHRQLLGSEMGVEPSSWAVAARDAILQGDADVSVAPFQDDASVGRGELPFPITRLLGREEELTEIERLLDSSRLVTLTGPGGVGKTRLAVEAAHRRTDRQVVVMCSLDHIDEPELVPHVVAHAVDVIDASGTTIPARIAAALRDQETLLVLDGCGAVIAAVAALVPTLLGRCPRLTILVTSREKCGLPGEHVVRLAPLCCEEPSPREASAVRLFLEIAAAADPGLETDDDTIRIAQDICRRVDGMPLAVELTAARLSAISIQDLADRLDPVPTQTGGPLLTAVESSYRLLDEGEKLALERLGVFPSDFSLAAALDVAAPSQPDVVDRLVDKSLVARAGASRYRLLETTRVYVRRQLEQRDDTGPSQARHARHYLELGSLAADGILTSEEGRWVAVTRAEMDNLRSAHRWAVARCSHPDTLQLAASMAHYAQWRLAPEPFRWATEAVSLKGSGDHPIFAAALGTVALGATNQGKLEKASRLAHRAMRQAGASPSDLLGATRALCLVSLYRGAAEECHRIGAELEEMATECGEVFFAVDSQLIRAAVDVFTDEPEASRRAQKALAAANGLGNPSLIALGHEVVAESLQQSHPIEALESFRRALETADSVSSHMVRGLALLGSSSTLIRLGRVSEAAESCRQAILHWRRAGRITHQWISLRNAAELLAHTDRLDMARSILQAADASETAPEAYGSQAQRLDRLQTRLSPMTTEHSPLPLDDILDESLAQLRVIAG